MINVAISERNRYFENGLKNLVKNYFFYKNLKVKFSHYERKLAGEPWLIFRALDKNINKYNCRPFISAGKQRIVPICMPEDLVDIGMLPCLQDTVFFFRNDSVEILLEKLDTLWQPWPENAYTDPASLCHTCGRCRFQQLTYNEKKVIRYISLGFTVSNISRMLKKNVKTVSSHKRSAMRKLNMSRDIELYRFLSYSDFL